MFWCLVISILPSHPTPTKTTQEELPEDVQHRSSDDLDEAQRSSNQPKPGQHLSIHIYHPGLGMSKGPKVSVFGVYFDI